MSVPPVVGVRGAEFALVDPAALTASVAPAADFALADPVAPPVAPSVAPPVAPPVVEMRGQHWVEKVKAGNAPTPWKAIRDVWPDKESQLWGQYEELCKGCGVQPCKPWDTLGARRKIGHQSKVVYYQLVILELQGKAQIKRVPLSGEGNCLDIEEVYLTPEGCEDINKMPIPLESFHWDDKIEKSFLMRNSKSEDPKVRSGLRADFENALKAHKSSTRIWETVGIVENQAFKDHKLKGKGLYSHGTTLRYIQSAREKQKRLHQGATGEYRALRRQCHGASIPALFVPSAADSTTVPSPDGSTSVPLTAGSTSVPLTAGFTSAPSPADSTTVPADSTTVPSPTGSIMPSMAPSFSSVVAERAPEKPPAAATAVTATTSFQLGCGPANSFKLGCGPCTKLVTHMSAPSAPVTALSSCTTDERDGIEALAMLGGDD